MKTNAKKLNKKLRTILALCLAVLFAFSGFLFAGCEVDSQGGGIGGEGGTTIPETFFENYVSGIAAVYANKENGEYSGLASSQDQTNKMLQLLRASLLVNYGSGAMSKYLYSLKAPFYDSIRMLVTAENGNINGNAKADLTKHWKWTIDPNATDIKLKNFNPESEDCSLDNSNYGNWATDFSNAISDPDTYQFPNYYSSILQIVLYEIMLGYENLTTLEVVVNSSTNPPPEASEITSSAIGTLYSVKVKSSSESDLVGLTIDWNFQSNNSTTSAKIDNDGQDLALAKLNAYLYGEGGTETNPTGGLMKEYLSKARYTGLTKQNADKLINYILNEIIGAELVVYDYNNFKGQPVNFRDYVSTIAYLVYSQTYDGSGDIWEYEFNSNGTKISYKFKKEDQEKAVENNLLNGETTDEGGTIKVTEVGSGSYKSKPATYVKYFPGESFFGDSEATDQFVGKPYAEYQSIVIVPAISDETTKENGLKLEVGFVFNFMSQNKDLRIIPTVRYCCYNESTRTRYFYEFKADEINFEDAESYVNADGKTCYENDFDFGVDVSKLDPSLVVEETDSTGYTASYYTVGFFKNKDLLNNVTNETQLSNPDCSAIQDFYKVVESENGFGGTTVIDERTINTSFFEIAFDIVKSESDPENTDYNFSLVLSNTILYPGIY